MSKPRYGWWPYVKDMIRRYPQLKEEYRELHKIPSEFEEVFYWTEEKIIGLKHRGTIKGRTNNPKSKDI